MIKLKKLLLIPLFVLGPLALPLLVSEEASAAACSTSGTIGSLSMTGNVSQAGQYVVWVRMQQAAPSANALRVEIGGSSCFQIGTGSMPANTWVWVNYSGTNTGNTMKHSFSSAGAKNVKIFATKYGVSVDRVILLGSSESCASNGKTPIGTGDNCNQAPSASSGPRGNAGQPGSHSSGSGESVPILPSIVADNPENVERVEYYIDGELVQTSYGAEPFDTNVLGEGTYTLRTVVTYKDGTTAESEEQIHVERVTAPSGQKTEGKEESRLKKPLLVSVSVLFVTGVAVTALSAYRYWR